VTPRWLTRYIAGDATDRLASQRVKGRGRHIRNMPMEGVEMAPSLFPDPLQIWREAVTKLESDVNSLATGSLKSQEVARSLHQFSSVSLGMQQMFEKVIDAYLR